MLRENRQKGSFGRGKVFRGAMSFSGSEIDIFLFYYKLFLHM